MPIQELVSGVHRFREQVFREQKDLFERLAGGQAPQTLFITCSDSRIDPNLITHTAPGDLFVLRNAGNIVPSYRATTGGETATIEFAVDGLGITDIVVCGHSHCGAMKGLLHPEIVKDMPAVAEWLQHAEATRRIAHAKYKHLPEANLLAATIEENVLIQIENLQTHPAVAVGMVQGRIKLHAWVYEIETGEVFAFDAATGQFKSLSDMRPQSAPVPERILKVDSGDSAFGLHDRPGQFRAEPF